MSDDYGDTGVDSTEDSQASDLGAEDYSQDTGDTGSESDADKSPVPYERFKESRDQLNESKTQVDELRQQMSALQSQQNESAQWNQWAWQQLQGQQESKAAPEEEAYYADPLEKRVNQLESSLQQQTQFYDHRHQEMQVSQAEKEIISELTTARGKYPEMRENDVINALTQNPNASIAALAKRSHEAEVNRFEGKLRTKGYKPKPKTLQRSVGSAGVVKDFGDDLEAAEAAAIEALGG
jgi:chromosome segregation ATPase